MVLLSMDWAKYYSMSWWMCCDYSLPMMFADDRHCKDLNIAKRPRENQCTDFYADHDRKYTAVDHFQVLSLRASRRDLSIVRLQWLMLHRKQMKPGDHCEGLWTNCLDRPACSPYWQN